MAKFFFGFYLHLSYYNKKYVAEYFIKKSWSWFLFCFVLAHSFGAKSPILGGPMSLTFSECIKVDGVTVARTCEEETIGKAKSHRRWGSDPLIYLFDMQALLQKKGRSRRLSFISI